MVNRYSNLHPKKIPLLRKEGYRGRQRFFRTGAFITLEGAISHKDSTPPSLPLQKGGRRKTGFYMLLKNVATQVLILHDILQVILNVAGIDDDFFLFQFLRFKGYVFQ